jgi:alkylated DNA repair dioxygenase AlkB
MADAGLMDLMTQLATTDIMKQVTLSEQSRVHHRSLDVLVDALNNAVTVAEAMPNAANLSDIVLRHRLATLKEITWILSKNSGNRSHSVMTPSSASPSASWIGIPPAFASSTQHQATHPQQSTIISSQSHSQPHNNDPRGQVEVSSSMAAREQAQHQHSAQQQQQQQLQDTLQHQQPQPQSQQQQQHKQHHQQQHQHQPQSQQQQQQQQQLQQMASVSVRPAISYPNQPEEKLNGHRLLRDTEVRKNSEEFLILRQLPTRARVLYLASDQSCWIIRVPGFRCSTPLEFDNFWSKHPSELGVVYFNGQAFTTQRYHKTFGQDYTFSGQTLPSAPLSEIPFVDSLVQVVNEISHASSLQFRYKMCLVNWYEPNHYIRPHSDDERQIVARSPIFSLSWGGTRTFHVFAKKPDPNLVNSIDIPMKDGDLIIMGGTLQETHKHEVPQVEHNLLHKTQRRINFTLRSFI